MKKLYLLLLLSACTQANDQPQKSYPLGTIPGLNATVKVTYSEHKYPLEPLTISTLLHAVLAATSTASSVQAKMAQHTLLWAASHAIGSSQSLSHELGHTIGHYMRGDHNLEIEIWGGITTLLTGSYSGLASYNCWPLDFPEEKTKENVLKHFGLIEELVKHDTKVQLAGPVSGTLTSYGMFKLLQAKYPIAFQNRWFKGACLGSILYSGLKDLNALEPGSDGYKIRDNLQIIQEISEAKKSLSNS